MHRLGIAKGNSATCVELPKCACPSSADICGSAFDDSCKVNPKSLYHCIGAGAQPERKEVCAEPCPDVDGPDSCKKPDKCVCQEVASYCGSGLSDACHAEANSRYACLEVGKPSQLITSAAAITRFAVKEKTTTCFVTEPVHIVCGCVAVWLVWNCVATSSRATATTSLESAPSTQSTRALAVSTRYQS